MPAGSKALYAGSFILRLLCRRGQRRRTRRRKKRRRRAGIN